jgi:hypothetical protein
MHPKAHLRSLPSVNRSLFQHVWAFPTISRYISSVWSTSTVPSHFLDSGSWIRHSLHSLRLWGIIFKVIDLHRWHFFGLPSINLSRKSIGAKLVFKVGEEPLPGFRMIERHYFKDQLIKSFDFTLGFCMFVPQMTSSLCLQYDSYCMTGPTPPTSGRWCILFPP